MGINDSVVKDDTASDVTSLQIYITLTVHSFVHASLTIYPLLMLLLQSQHGFTPRLRLP